MDEEITLNQITFSVPDDAMAVYSKFGLSTPFSVLVSLEEFAPAQVITVQIIDSVNGFVNLRFGDSTYRNLTNVSKFIEGTFTFDKTNKQITVYKTLEEAAA